MKEKGKIVRCAMFHVTSHDKMIDRSYRILTLYSIGTKYKALIPSNLGLMAFFLTFWTNHKND